MSPLKKNVLIAITLLPVFFLLHNYNELFGFIKTSQVINYGLIIYGSIAVCLLILLLTKKWTAKSSVVLLSLVFFILLFGPINNYIRLIVHTSILRSYYIVFGICFLILVVIIRKIVKAKSISEKTIQFLNIATIFITATELFMFFNNQSIYNKTKNLIYPYKPLSEKYVSPNSPDSSKPDIYFFVFDAYTNNKMLKEIWNYDNTALTDWLKDNGFHLPSNTRSNYNFTAFSVSSTFNMNYIDPRKGSNASIPKNILEANESMSNNETMDILKKENYSINFLAPFKNCIQENNLGHFFEYLSDRQIARQTLIGSLRDSKAWHYVLNKWSNTNDSLTYQEPLLKKLGLIRNTVAEIEGTVDSTTNRKPHFVYGHIMVPHEPPLFDLSGNFLSYDQTLHALPFDTYTAQIRYANTLIKEIVSYIKAHNKPNTIIIIEGDHGYGFFPQDSIPRFAFSNFNAFYFPDKNYSRLYDTMSPINTFRIVFDQYFNQDFPLLKDSSTVVSE
jgi:sulfatase-like protein